MLLFEFDRLFDLQRSSYAHLFSQTRLFLFSKCVIERRLTPGFGPLQTFQSFPSTRASSLRFTGSFSCFLL